jgi:hypothetical protein
MDYYEKKIDFYKWLEQVIKSNKTISLSQITIVTENKYGFGKNLLLKRLNNYAENDFISIDKDIITSHAYKKSKEADRKELQKEIDKVLTK